jgi:hypothetical protein
MVMMNVLELHNLHLEAVLRRVLDGESSSSSERHEHLPADPQRESSAALLERDSDPQPEPELEPELEPEPEPELEQGTLTAEISVDSGVYTGRVDEPDLLSVQEVLDQFLDVKQILAKTSERWSAVLFIECAITVCIACEPLMYAVIQTQSGGHGVDSSEASVFFAATLPFIAILIVGLAGISRINERIAQIPVCG